MQLSDAGDLTRRHRPEQMVDARNGAEVEEEPEALAVAQPRQCFKQARLGVQKALSHSVLRDGGADLQPEDAPPAPPPTVDVLDLFR